MNSGPAAAGWRGPRSWMTGTRARESSSRPVSSAHTSSAAGGAGRGARAVAQGKVRQRRWHILDLSVFRLIAVTICV